MSVHNFIFIISLTSSFLSLYGCFAHIRTASFSQEPLDRAKRQTSTGSGSAINGNKYRWPNRQVVYVLDSAISANGKNLIFQAMDAYENATCIKWVPRSSEADYVYIRNQPTGCWSIVGRTGNQQVLNIEEPDCAFVDIILHEMTHAVGFQHEHIRPDRDSFVTINFDNVLAGQRYNYNIVKQTDIVPLGSAYDYGSLMHYDKEGFAINNSTPVMITSDPTFEDIIGTVKTFSSADIFEINTLYNC